MKSILEDYENFSQEKIAAIWEKAIIVLDTNILLNLYRYSESTRDNIIQVMEALKDRLWMPYQVGIEYFNNRESTFMAIAQMGDGLKKQLDEGKKDLLNAYNKKETSRHPHLDKTELGKVYDEAVKAVKEFIDQQSAKFHDYKYDDVVLKKLLTLYDGKVGNDFTTDELFQIYQEGEIRYAGLIPPGFKDEAEKRGKGLRHLFGDLIIWKDMIRYSKENNVDIIFVTEDTKEDWWEKNAGKSTPKKELLREFRKETGDHTILMYQQKGFLDASNQKIYKTTANEVEETSKEDERIARERTEQFLDGVRQGLTSSATSISASAAAITTPAWLQVFKNPLLATLEEQKKMQERFVSPLAGYTESMAAMQEKMMGATEAIRKLTSSLNSCSMMDTVE